MTTLSERLRIALDGPPSRTQAALARACGLKAPSINGWLSGKTQTIEGQNLLKASAFLGVSPKWLATGVGSQKELSGVVAYHPDDPVPEDSILIPESRIGFSAGNGRQVSYEIVEDAEPATYRLSWFQKYGINPANVRRFKVVGDSMEPFLYAGDSVLVHLAENDPLRIIDGKVYALRYGNELRIKRLYRRLDGTLTLRSDNRDYKDEDVAPELAEEHITLFGRVRDKSGAGGL